MHSLLAVSHQDMRLLCYSRTLAGRRLNNACELIRLYGRCVTAENAR
jgi:hypothetical protein